MKYSLPPVNTPASAALVPDAVLVANGAGSPDWSPAQNDLERSVLALIDGKRTVAEILRASQTSGFVTMRQLRSLSERRIIHAVSHRVGNSPASWASARLAARPKTLTQDLTAVADAFAVGRQPARQPAPAPFEWDNVPTPPPQVKPPTRVTVSIVPTVQRGLALRSSARPPRPAAPLGWIASQTVDLWFALRKREWSTLAVIPAHRGGSGLEIARALAEAGGSILGRPVELLSAEGEDLVPLTDWIFPREGSDPFRRVVALDPVAVNPMVIPVAQAADAVLIVVERGARLLDETRRTAEAIGKKHITGCVLIS
jgi:hypothetical protein